MVNKLVMAEEDIGFVVLAILAFVVIVMLILLSCYACVFRQLFCQNVLASDEYKRRRADSTVPDDFQMADTTQNIEISAETCVDTDPQ
ncbi:hypothetical protein LSTR_LSTR003197 [Laodelphax striatellus]|uniref:Uncharacterized protein n=1 Tax=Laodelphax striatellus TaxID=195883 RepID=A0A482XTM0_LAOST|nr:hypothetical protein LSTR_LSTR003197 [Laodelphax striatellus]